MTQQGPKGLDVDQERRRLPGLVLEGIVILVSILAAFFLEGWRDDREVAQGLRLELLSVQQELERNRVLLASSVSNLGRIEIAGTHLLDVLEESPESMVPVPDTIGWVGAVWITSFDASLGGVKALIASGRLAQVEDPGLRLGLAGLEDSVRDAVEEELSGGRVTTDHILPMLGRKTDVKPLQRVVEGFFDTPAATTGLTISEGLRDRRMPSFGDFSFPNDQELRNALRVRMIWLGNAQDEFGRLDAQLVDLIEMLSREID